MSTDTGMSKQQCQAVAATLSKLLADSYMLYLKTHHFHWNVTGPQFPSLHSMFETQYSELASAVDEIAERIRALGEYAPGSFSQFNKLTSIVEESTVPSANEMLQQLARGQDKLIHTCQEAMSIVEDAHDAATADLLTRRILQHEKNAWMLRSSLS